MISSIPMRRSPSKGYFADRASSTTRLTMAPTLVHATRSSSTMAVLEVCTASQATVSSKARVLAGAVTGPGEGHHRRAVLGAVHPRGVCLHEGTNLAQVQRPPAAAPPHPGRSPVPAARSGHSDACEAASAARELPPPRRPHRISTRSITA